MRNINEIRNYFVEETDQNELMSNKHKRACMTINYIEQFLILAFTITGCISISTFGITTAITNSAIGLKPCAITAEIKKYKSMINEKKKKHCKILLLAKS